MVGGPYSGGQSHQRQPLFNTCTMPLMTRRSSARSTPARLLVDEARSAPIAHRSAKTGSCAWSRSPESSAKRRRIIVLASPRTSLDSRNSIDWKALPWACRNVFTYALLTWHNKSSRNRGTMQNVGRQQRGIRLCHGNDKAQCRWWCSQ